MTRDINQTNTMEGMNVSGSGNTFNQTNVASDNSVTYPISKQDNYLGEMLSNWVLTILGERNTLITAIVGLVLAFGSFLNYLYDVIAFISKEISMGVGIVTLFIGLFMLVVLQFKDKSHCNKCGKDWALIETGEPYAKEVKAHDGVHIQEFRKYKCQFCGNEIDTKEKFFKQYSKDN